MSTVLKRMQELRKQRESAVPSGVAQDITDRYLSDLKQEYREKAFIELQNQLIETANKAELDSALDKIQSLESERALLNQMLNEARSKTVQLEDLVKSLNAKIEIDSISHEEKESEHCLIIKDYEDRLKQMEIALSQPPVIPAPIINQAPVPSFEFTPVRGPDGRIESVSARPVGN